MDLAEIAFDAAPLGLALTEDRVVRRCNARFAEVFGGTPTDFVDMPLRQLYPTVRDYEATGVRGIEIMRDTGRYQDERVMRRLSAEMFWCRVQGQSLTPNDPFRRAVWAFTDISAERPIFSLTPRERDVAMLTCQGLTSKEIGLKLDLSYRTVEAHRARLMRKVGARNTPDLVAKFSGMPH